jgi:hypothetical protein
MLYRRVQPSQDDVEPRPTAATIPAEYYNWLRRSLEKVELLGAKEGRAVYDSGGRLSEDRYQLYRRIVDNVLFHRFRDEVRGVSRRGRGWKRSRSACTRATPSPRG